MRGGSERMVAVTVSVHIMNIRCWENTGTMDKQHTQIHFTQSSNRTNNCWKQQQRNMFLCSRSPYLIHVSNKQQQETPQFHFSSVKLRSSPSASRAVQPCDSCLSYLHRSGTSPSRDGEDFAVSHSWTPYIHPAGTVSVFSFHIIGVTPHSCYNSSASA